MAEANIPVLTGNTADDTEAISAGTGQKLAVGGGGTPSLASMLRSGVAPGQQIVNGVTGTQMGNGTNAGPGSPSSEPVNERRPIELSRCVISKAATLSRET